MVSGLGQHDQLWVRIGVVGDFPGLDFPPPSLLRAEGVLALGFFDGAQDRRFFGFNLCGSTLYIVLH